MYKFIAFRKALDLSNNFEQSVYEVYGNLKAKREREIFDEIDEIGQDFYERFSTVSERVKTLEDTSSNLIKRIYELEQFNSRLEQLEIGLRKTKIKDLLNDQSKN